MRIGVVHAIVIFIILWLFSLTKKPTEMTKEVVYWVMILLLIIAFFLVGPVLQVSG